MNVTAFNACISSLIHIKMTTYVT